MLSLTPAHGNFLPREGPELPVSNRITRRSKTKECHKQEQLCSQVAETISLSLGDSADRRLGDLVVHSVVPTPDGARLLVIVRVTEPASIEALNELHDVLNSARAWLRAEVASDIHRKRAPDLTFRVLPPSDEEP